MLQAGGAGAARCLINRSKDLEEVVQLGGAGGAAGAGMRAPAPGKPNACRRHARVSRSRPEQAQQAQRAQQPTSSVSQARNSLKNSVTNCEWLIEATICDKLSRCAQRLGLWLWLFC